MQASVWLCMPVSLADLPQPIMLSFPTVLLSLLVVCLVCIFPTVFQLEGQCVASHMFSFFSYLFYYYSVISVYFLHSSLVASLPFCFSLCLVSIYFVLLTFDDWLL